MAVIPFKEAWRLRSSKTGPGVTNMAWILESVDEEGSSKIFLGRINGEYVAISGTCGKVVDINEFGATKQDWNQKEGRWVYEFRVVRRVELETTSS